MAENKYLRAMKQATEHVEKQEEPILPPQVPVVRAEAPAPHRPSRRPGRPPGKRSNPDWEQLTIFIRSETKRAAMLRLMESQHGKDLSEVIEQLLSRWSKSA
jgi:hypothetical protein